MIVTITDLHERLAREFRRSHRTRLASVWLAQRAVDAAEASTDLCAACARTVGDIRRSPRRVAIGEP